MLNTQCYINWNGISSASLGDIVVTKASNSNIPRRKCETVKVPGRNGDLVFYQDAWENVVRSYEIVAGDGQDGSAIPKYREIADWLMPEESAVTVNDYINLTLNGYHQLIDGEDPNVIMLAYFTGPVDVDNILSRAGRARLEFSCRPERFASNAFTAITKTSSGGYVTNNNRAGAKPFLKVFGSGNGTLTVNGYVMTITGMSDYLHIDCDSQNCFRLLAENRNNLLTLTSGFPVLKTGNNYITWTGGITKVEITPRWWKL